MSGSSYLDGINIWMIMYIIGCIGLGAGGTFYFYKKTQPFAAFIFFVGCIIIFIIYGSRWFSSNGIYSENQVSWPPAINTCPDFLTAYDISITNGKIQGCVDTIGVSRNGAFQKLPSSGKPTDSRSTPYATVGGIVTTQLTDFFPINVAGETSQGLCNRLGQYGLTWDGIFDGDNCLATSS